uniref:Crossover junction endonuclease MUS81 n=1 Tax=Sphenodon punctatus TaxID=8508 RepID=A0A8D0GS17_SPHPU
MPGRKRPLPTCPNPLFTRWLELWRDAAAEQGRSRARDAYQRALNSLRKYPLPLQSGREAQILQYFGDRICRQLDEELDRHRSQHGLDHPCPVPSGEQEKSRPSSKDGDDSLALQPAQCPMEPPPMKRMLRRPARKYVPARRSGAYAVLLALYRDSTIPQGQGFLTKPELQRAAQPLCDKSFSQADPGSKYTAWASVGTLIRKELLLKTNIPARCECWGRAGGSGVGAVLQGVGQ